MSWLIWNIGIFTSCLVKRGLNELMMLMTWMMTHRLLRTYFDCYLWFLSIDWLEQHRSAAFVKRASAWCHYYSSCCITDFLCLLKNELDPGEAEAIALAKEIKAKLILLDERDARKIAKSLSLNVLGTVGLLIQAKQTGKIESLQTMLDLLKNEAHFRISESLYDLALKVVDESEK